MTKSVIDKKKADVPHIFHVIPSFAHGGVPIRISYLMNHFGPLVRHSLLSTDGIYSCESRLNKNVIYEIPEIGTADEGNILKRLWQYRQIIRKMQPDLLLTYNWGSTEWAMANSINPICRHFHLESGFGPEEANGTLGRRNLFRRLALRNIEGIVVPSNTLVKICASDWRISARKILYTPNGVDCDLYASPPQEGIIPGFTKQAGEITIGTMTPLRPEKNLPRLITAFNHLVQSRPDQKTSLIIMGEGRERPKLEQIITGYGLQNKIYLPGHIDNPAMALGHLDIYALSSDTEQMPNSVNQAMAAGLPVVGLDVGDVKFIVSTANKPFITAAGDDEAFTSALTELTAHERLRNEIGDDNKRHVGKTYDQSRMFAAYAKIWGVTAS